MDEPNITIKFVYKETVSMILENSLGSYREVYDMGKTRYNLIID